MTSTQQALEVRAAELRAVLDAPSEKERAAGELQRVEAQLAEQRDATTRAEAERRLVAISRAYGSVAHELDADAEKARQALDEARARLESVNARFVRAGQLRAEVAQIAARHSGIKCPSLPPVVVPVRRGITLDLPELLDHMPLIRPSTKEKRAERMQEQAADPLAAGMAAELAALPATVSVAGAGVHRG